MASIAEWIQRIKTAIYGEEVRGAIWQSLQAMNDELTSADVTQIPVNKADIADLKTDMTEVQGSVTSLQGDVETAGAEVEDIRVGADGTQYENAGTAVRTQIADLKSAFVMDGVGNGILNVMSSGNKITTEYDGGLKVEYVNGMYHVTGKIAASAPYKFFNIIASPNSLPEGIIAGERYTLRLVECNASAVNHPVLALFYKIGSAEFKFGYSVISTNESNGVEFIIPSQWTGFIARFDFEAGKTYDNWLLPIFQRVDADSVAEAANTIRTIAANNSLLSVENDLLNKYRPSFEFVLSNGISFSPRGNVFRIYGTSTSPHTFYNLFAKSNELPEGMVAGHTYLISCSVKGVSENNLLFQSYYYDGNGTLKMLTSGQINAIVKIPSDAVGFLVRIYIVGNGVQIDNAEVSYGIYDVEKVSARMNVSELMPGTDVHAIKATGYYIGVTVEHLTEPYANAPIEPPFFLWHYQSDKLNAIQICANWDATALYMCRGRNNEFTPWHQLSGGDVIANNYTNEHYNNTYNITCNPQITTDTNNYIAAPSDTRDMTGAIQTMLTNNKVCRLGPGDFYVTGIEVPSFGALIGSGWRTRIILAENVTNGYAVKITTNSFVKDLFIGGNASPGSITCPTSVGTRHGILFEGTADAESGAVTYYRSNVENCMIRNFTGGGITLRNTGFSWASSLAISDCRIYWCGAGINIAYFSEFSRITNVTVNESLYGCIDNGGNNNFANCDFSGNTVGLLIDNSSGQSRNNTHGSFVGCTFNHSGNNSGTAIRILGATGGEIFTAAQIFFGKIEIEDSMGIRFIGANLGRQTPIIVKDSVVTAFSDCTFTSASESPLTHSGNTRLVFDRCYDQNGNVFNPVQ